MIWYLIGMSNSPTVSSFRVNVTGERLRGLISLRIKEHDRNLAKVELAVEQLTVDLKEAESATDEKFSKQFARAGRGEHRELGLGNSYESVGLSAVASLRQRISELSDGLSLLRYEKAQLAWLSESLEPDVRYELNTFDMMTFGFNSALSTNDRHGFRLGGLLGQVC